MGLKDVLKRSIAKREEFKEMQNRRMMENKLDELEKSANERELERFIKERREENIKKQLDGFRKKKQEEFWTGNTFSGKNIFNDQKQILKQPNIFKLESTNLIGSGMFFK